MKYLPISVCVHTDNELRSSTVTSVFWSNSRRCQLALLGDELNLMSVKTTGMYDMHDHRRERKTSEW